MALPPQTLPSNPAISISFTAPGSDYPGFNFHDVLREPSSSSWGSDLYLLSQKPFETVKADCEKISLDFGPWIKAIGQGPTNFQVRIRASKRQQATRTLRQVVEAIVGLINKRMQGILGENVPELSHWYFIGMEQKLKRIATFNCYFVVQGHTRTVLSHDTNVSSVLDELRGHYMPVQGLYPMPTPDDAAAWAQGNNTHTDDAMMGEVQFTYGVLYGYPSD